ncbi:hypothetical protein BC941DRAFT_470850 [Chlamydoabsidia padenii]|nr:hypothetical protein BC941DRAFT_470850 [Chlamydoabsidia padenii]
MTSDTQPEWTNLGLESALTDRIGNRCYAPISLLEKYTVSVDIGNGIEPTTLLSSGVTRYWDTLANRYILVAIMNWQLSAGDTNDPTIGAGPLIESKLKFRYVKMISNSIQAIQPTYLANPLCLFGLDRKTNKGGLGSQNTGIDHQGSDLMVYYKNRNNVSSKKVPWITKKGDFIVCNRIDHQHLGTYYIQALDVFYL